MKIHVLSDIHLEFGKWPKSVDINAIDADVTVLAGDIGVGLEGIQWALSFDRPVVYVMGNHEFYGQRPMNDLWRKAREKVTDTHVHLLENDTLLLDDPQRPGETVRFLGATLWTDFAILGPGEQEDSMESAARTMSDYSTIYVSRRGRAIVDHGMSTGHEGDRLTPRKTLSWHHESRDFLEQELRRLPDNLDFLHSWNKTVVVTHHAPSAKSLLYQQVGGRLDAAYASDLEHIVAQADLWIHGHVHVLSDYRIGNGRVVSNPRGYIGSGPVSNFNPSLVVEV